MIETSTVANASGVISIGPFRFRPVTADDAHAIVAWRYSPPYDFYDFTTSDWAEIASPASGFVAVDASAEWIAGESQAGFDVATKDHFALVGYACFGRHAQVAGAHQAELYGGDALDIGLGMRPDLTGQGRGAIFIDTLIAYTTERFQLSALRLVVAIFNHRAMSVYARAGFVAGPVFMSPTRSGDVEFRMMMRR